MGPAVYKPGQGYWTRMMTAIGVGLVGLMCAVWLWEELNDARVGQLQPVYIQGIGVVVVAAITGLIVYRFVGMKPRAVDFLIATEGEMKKVNWSTRREIIGSTWVVIGLTIFIAIIIAILDSVFAEIFRAIGVLEG